MSVWDRFSDPHFWRMPAMAGLWLVFATMVFVLEPLMRARFEQEADRRPKRILRRLSLMHVALLVVAALTVLGAVMGSQGFNIL